MVHVRRQEGRVLGQARQGGGPVAHETEVARRVEARPPLAEGRAGP